MNFNVVTAVSNRSDVSAYILNHILNIIFQ